MTREDRAPSRTFTLPSVAIAAATAGFSPAPASAAGYDMDCKLILCMPTGFPSGCGDALDYMVDRLRDGKSPIGFCAMNDGTEYDSYDIDYSVMQATSPQGWQCPAGKTLYHSTRSQGDSRKFVNTFCYDTAYTRRGWTPDGYKRTTTYTNKTPPERTDFWVNLTVEPDTDAAYSPGWQKFDADIYRDWMTTIRHSE